MRTALTVAVVCAVLLATNTAAAPMPAPEKPPAAVKVVVREPELNFNPFGGHRGPHGTTMGRELHPDADADLERRERRPGDDGKGGHFWDTTMGRKRERRPGHRGPRPVVGRAVDAVFDELDLREALPADPADPAASASTSAADAGATADLGNAKVHEVDPQEPAGCVIA
ncbi:hypothetical protein MIND_00395400 [Mycena indigotica]|uniref:Secreted protein n=1 Tax=Mycena indigotica TaxID=2126181 RepID=A0A8H6W9Z6_9AGAR|nr:uncharacterized protein MIND_00395400 [Mycena indigotica]KAF7310217.1 hypothetical protein MIND_00395400 [Mycena indigotica]